MAIKIETPDREDVKKKKKSEKPIPYDKREVLYPVFEQCVQHTTDDFWKNIFENFSMGKCPKGLYISKDTIYSSNKKKGVFYNIPQYESIAQSKNVFSEVRNILMNELSICSNIDIDNKKREISETNKPGEINDDTVWSEIRKKNTREIYIIKFVLRMKRKYNLDWHNTQDLYSLVHTSFIYKSQSSKDVNFKNKRIESINGIEYDESLKKFVNKYIVAGCEVDEVLKESCKKYLSDYWDRYVYTTNRQI